MSRSLCVAIYARYSSDLQNPSSIEDQISLCRRLVRQHFSNVSRISIYKDAALTGSNMLRPGLLALMEDVAARQVNIIVSEGLDRISRNLGDLARIHDLCGSAEVKIWTAHEGFVGDLHIGFKGTMNALYLKDLKEKVRRAHQARAADGFAPAGLSYGYRVKRDERSSDGKFVNGVREIDEGQAKIVRRIFEAIADGIPVRSMVKTLNDEGVPSPSGGRWSVNSIVGAPSRGQGILHNELYRGILIYNRTRKVVDRATGRVRHPLNPENEWVRKAVPELRIVHEELWIRAHSKRKQFRFKTPRIAKGELPLVETRAARAHALTGLVYCGECGSIKTLADRGRYICEGFRRTRSCSNARGTNEKQIAEHLIGELTTALRQKSGLKKELKELFLETVKAQRLEQDRRRDLLEKKERLLDAIENGVPMKAVFERVAGLEAQLEQMPALPKLPPLEASEREIKRDIHDALHIAFENIEDVRFAAPIRRMLAMVVDRIELFPIRTQRAGEELSVKLKPDGWAALYCHIHDAWPGVDRTEFEAG